MAKRLVPLVRNSLHHALGHAVVATLMIACGSVSEGGGNDGSDVDGSPGDGNANGCEPSVVFSANGDVMLIERDGNGLVNLTNSPDTVEIRPQFSPDGSKLAFVSQDVAGVGTAVVANADGTDGLTITLEPMDNVNKLAWIGNERLVFFNESDILTGDMLAINADGSRRRSVRTPVLPGGSLSVAFATNRIAYTPRGQTSLFAMATIGFDGTDEVVLPTEGARPTLSPDGTRLVYSFDNDVRSINVDGTDEVNLTTTPDVTDIAPVWGADGTQIFYLRELNGAQRDVFSMSSDGTGQMNMTSSAKEEIQPIVVSLDGQFIAFTNGALVVAQSDGSGVTELAGTAGAQGPSWRSCP